MQHEFQAAYQLSQMEHRPCDGIGHFIRAAEEAGLVYVLLAQPAYCRITDAMLPTPHYFWRGSFDTRAEAEAAVEEWVEDLHPCDEGYFRIYPDLLVAELTEPSWGEDIPF